MGGNGLPLDSKPNKEHLFPLTAQPANSPLGSPSPASSKEQQSHRAQPISHVNGAPRKASRKFSELDSPPLESGSHSSSEILRFRESERMLHWAIAIPFMVCWVTALVLVVVYNPDPARPYRDVFSAMHRVSAIGLILFPCMVMLRNRRDYRIHLYNVKCAWLWSLNDLKWLSLMGLAAVSKKIVLPEQGKFNAAEKVNFMSVMVACPVFILTGIMIWLQELAWAAWLVHAFFALLVSPTMLGHIYMATINPETRTGLKGIISGYVDRQWARHHYGLWYSEQFENKRFVQAVVSENIHPPDSHVRIHCPSCNGITSVSWAWLLPKIFSTIPILCPNCGAKFEAINTVTNQQELDWIRHEMEGKPPVTEPP